MIKNEIIKMHLQDKRTENSSREALTAEKLRTFPGFENASEKEAENMVYSIHTFCRIIYEYMIEQGNSFEVHNPINIAA
jgi:hypothetical protein